MMTQSVPEIALEMRGVTKRFGPVVANDAIDLRVRAGTVHGLCGENGAGKSTLMNILYGLHRPDAGEIRVHGEVVHFRGPADAIAAGIGMVHQHFMLVGPLTVTENIVLGSEPRQSAFLIDREAARRRVLDLTERYGLAVPPDEPVDMLPVGLAQRVEILKTLYRGARILILDEPTAVLTPLEVKDLLRIMRGLAESGVTVVFISHKLKEVRETTDEITVIQTGRSVGHADTKDVDEAAIARMMVGRDVLLELERTEGKPSDVALRVEGLVKNRPNGSVALAGMSFELRRGEILGVAGVEGNGQSELVEILAGLSRAERGIASFRDRSNASHDLAALSAREIAELGIAHVPEDRGKRGLVLPFSIVENLVLGRIEHAPFASRLGVTDPEALRTHGQALADAFDIRAGSVFQSAGSLSGGNAQKIVIAREFTGHRGRLPELVLISQPTRGVDVGAIEFIHRKIIALRDQGVAILLVSAELSEVMSLSDRLMVFYRGKIVAEFAGAAAREDEVGLAMMGGKAA